MLLANDSDPNGDPLAITEVSGATNGTAAFDSQTNVITFTPNANYTGTANFSYTVSDGTGGTATASVGLTVTPPTTSLFSSSDTPAALSISDASEVILVVRFEASTVRAIWGVKYYKGDGDTGTHVGSLWTSDGHCWRAQHSPTKHPQAGRAFSSANPFQSRPDHVRRQLSQQRPLRIYKQLFHYGPYSWPPDCVLLLTTAS